jgi:hypothetical protein
MLCCICLAVLSQNDSLATLLARLEGILGPLPGWMVAQGRYSNRYYTRSRQLYERSKASGRWVCGLVGPGVLTR